VTRPIEYRLAGHSSETGSAATDSAANSDAPPGWRRSIDTSFALPVTEIDGAAPTACENATLSAVSSRADRISTGSATGE